MTEKFIFDDVIKEVLDEEDVRWFDLEFPEAENLEDIKTHRAKAVHLASNWCGRVMLSTGTKFFAEIMITDARPNGSCVFRVILANCDWQEFEAGEYLGRWEALTGRSAVRITFEPKRLPGQLRHLVMDLDCPMSVITSTFATNPKFRREDFR